MWVEEFAANVYWALTHDPHPLTTQQRYTLSWEAANERLIQAASMTSDENESSFSDKVAVWLLDSLGSGKYGDAMRALLGGRNAAPQNEYMNRYGASIPTNDAVLN